MDTITLGENLAKSAFSVCVMGATGHIGATRPPAEMPSATRCPPPYTVTQHASRPTCNPITGSLPKARGKSLMCPD
jgi:hypothetical protein